MVLHPPNNQPVIDYSVVSEATQYSRSMQIYSDGKLIASLRSTSLFDKGENSFQGSLEPDKVRNLVERIIGAISGVRGDICEGIEEIDFHQRVRINVGVRGLSYVDVPPSPDVEEIVEELNQLYFGLPWPN